MVWSHNCLLTHSVVDRQVSDFQSEALKIWYVLLVCSCNASQNPHVSIPSGCIPRNGPSGPQDVCVLQHGRPCRADFQSNCTVLSPTNDLCDLCFLYFLRSTCCCWFCCSQSLAHVWREVLSGYGLLSLLAGEAGLFSCAPWTSCCLSLDDCSGLCPFLE